MDHEIRDFLNHAIQIAKVYVFVIFTAFIVLIYLGGESSRKLGDSKIPVYLESIERYFPDEFVGTAEYWEDRDDYYKHFCPTLWEDGACQHEKYSHRDYMNHKYDDVYERIARIEREKLTK